VRLHLVDICVIALYFAVLFAIGIFFSRRQTDRDEYFLGRRKMNWLLVGISVSATLLTSASYIGMPGELIKHGLGYFVWMPTIIVITPFINRVIIPVLMGLKTTTVYDYLEGRYGLPARLLGATVFSTTRLLWTGLVIYTISFALAEMTSLPIWQIIIGIGIITTLFTTAGGAVAVIWTDCFQFLIQLTGALFVPIYIAYLTKAGPAEWWDAFSRAGRTTVPVFSLDLTVRLTIVGAVLESVFWNVCTHSSDQLATQRYFSTPSVKAAQRSVWVFTVAQILLTVLLMLCGVALF